MAEREGLARLRPRQLGSSRKDPRTAARATRRDFLRFGVATTGALSAALYVKPGITTVGVPKAFAAMSPLPVLEEAHFPVCVDFDESFLHPSDVVTN